MTSALGVAWVSTIAEITGKKWGMIQLSFPTDTTGEFPFAGLDRCNFSTYNRWTYRFIRWVFWRQTRHGVNTFRRSLGLMPLRESIFDKAVSDRVLILYAVSPALLPRPADWAPNIKVTGFLTLPKINSNLSSRLPSPASKPTISPEALRQWLLAGDKPIYIGFGSMPILGPALFRQLLIDLLAFTPHRYLFCTGWSGASNLPTHPRLFILPSANHDQLFPHCKAAIIHGGIGTLAATLRAATPPIIVSIFGDQHWWGKLIQKRHLGRHLPFKQLSTAKLIATIETVLSPPITQNGTALASQLNRETGVPNLLTSLEQYFSSAKR